MVNSFKYFKCNPFVVEIIFVLFILWQERHAVTHNETAMIERVGDVMSHNGALF